MILLGMDVIEIKEVSKTYFNRGGSSTVVDKLSLSVKQGEVFGFLGPNGAGKTTTMKMLVGLTRPTSGEVRILGARPQAIEIRSKIGFMPENASFYLYLSGKEFLNFVADIFGLSKAQKEEKIDNLLREVDLYEARNVQIRKYSKGMGQRLGLAQALINDPEVLFLDEPLDGLDPLGRVEAKDLLINLKKAGKTIFFNSHILSDVEDICDRVGILDRGHLIVSGSVEEVKREFSTLEEAFVNIIKKVRTKDN